MAILQNNGAAPAENGDASHGSESDDMGPTLMLPSSSEESDLDSGMESDEHDIISFLEPGSELCQIGNQTIALPVELYELDNLGEVLSVDTWNGVLDDSDRLELAKYLPDMDQETFAQTLSELFGGKNFCFGSPLSGFFDRLRGGQCDPRVALFRKGMDFVQRRVHYCSLRRYHDSMLGRIWWVKEAWQNCEGYGLEENMRLLHIMRNQESLASESDQNAEFELEPESETQTESESELRNSDSDERYYRNGAAFKESSASGFLKRRNQNPSFARNEKRGMKSRQLRCDEENDDQEKYAVSRKFQGKVKDRSKLGSTVKPDKNSLSKSGMRVNGSKGKGSNKKSLKDEDNSKNSRAEMKGSLKKCEDAESDLSQKGVVEPVFDSGKPKKKIKSKKAVVVQPAVDSGKPKKKIKSKKEALTTEVQVEPIEGNTSHTKSRKIGKKRKPVVLPGVPEKLDTDSILNNENIVPEKVEENEEKMADTQLVEVPVLQETETPTKKQKKKTVGENSAKKRKLEKLDSDSPVPEPDSVTGTKKKRGKKKLEPAPDAEAALPIEAVKQEETEPVAEPVKPPKKEYVPITPTVHTGFSFSIVHLLSAIRNAMVKVDMKADVLPTTDNLETVRSDELAATQIQSLPSLTLTEIVEGVKLDPLDMSILKAPEHLNELIRGALRIFSSKHAPLGAKAWKPLVAYTSSNKSWVWAGPVVKPTDDITFDEQTSPEMWGLPQKSLVKLIDSFANWLKQGEEILKRISSLPQPPVPMHATLEEKDRFKEMKSLKSQSTICPCSEEVRAYYRLEEAIRYSIPDRAFMYTATDGRKSTVAPLGRGGGKKMSTKARDHFMLKPDRPPHVTILGLVRDAASRLPGSIGTRADVCTLIRDSQYIVDDVADEKISEVISGALDRLHYEQDPCVKFDSERKLWAYLHREREEEDFEDEGTSSTKKWKKPKKEIPESTQIEAVNSGEATNANNGILEVQGSFVNADASEVARPFGDLSLLYGENTLVGQPGQENLFACQPDQQNPFVCQPGQENPLVCQPGQQNLFVCQPGQENPFVCQPGQENPFLCQPGQENPFLCQTGQQSPFVCQPGQDNPYACQPGHENLFGSQLASSNIVLGEPFVDGRPLGFFDTTLL